MQRQGLKRVFKNGLTEDQAIKARSILKQVNVTSICKASNIDVSIIYNVLRDQSPKVELLAIVLTQAKKQIREKQRTLKKLPL